MEQHDHHPQDGCSFAASVLIIAVMVGGFFVSISRTIPGLEPLGIAILSAPFCLLAIWLALGNSALAIRFALAALPGVLEGLDAFTDHHLTTLQRFGFFTGTTLLIPMMAIPSVLVRLVGFRLVRLAASDDKAPMETRPIQFSLRQLFGLTAVVAAMALFAKLVAGNTSQKFAINLLGAMTVVALNGAGAVWAAFGRSNPIVRLILLSAVSGSITFLFCIGLREPSDNLHLTAGWATLIPLATGAVLLLFRRRGYRLLRVRSE